MPDRVASASPPPPSPETFRKRLLRHGPSALTDAELLAVLLRGGSRDRSALELSTQILDDLGGLRGIGKRPNRLCDMHGLGPSHLASLEAAHEIACRLARSKIQRTALMDRPEAVAEYVGVRYGSADQEVLGVIYLNMRNRLIAEREVFRGTLSRIAVEPRQILKTALDHRAAGLLMFHTHTSNDPSPSQDDRYFTRRIEDAAELMGIRFVDHLIVAQGGLWTSLRRGKKKPRFKKRDQILD